MRALFLAILSTCAGATHWGQAPDGEPRLEIPNAIPDSSSTQGFDFARQIETLKRERKDMLDVYSAKSPEVARIDAQIRLFREFQQEQQQHPYTRSDRTLTPNEVRQAKWLKAQIAYCEAQRQVLAASEPKNKKGVAQWKQREQKYQQQLDHLKPHLTPQRQNMPWYGGEATHLVEI